MKTYLLFFLSFVGLAAFGQDSLTVTANGCDIEVRVSVPRLSKTYDARTLAWDTIAGKVGSVRLDDGSTRDWFYASFLTNFDNRDSLFAFFQREHDSCRIYHIDSNVRIMGTLTVDSTTDFDGVVNFNGGNIQMGQFSIVDGDSALTISDTLSASIEMGVQSSALLSNAVSASFGGRIFYVGEDFNGDTLAGMGFLRGTTLSIIQVGGGAGQDNTILLSVRDIVGGPYINMVIDSLGLRFDGLPDSASAVPGYVGTRANGDLFIKP